MGGKETAKEVDEWIFTSMHINRLITTERKEVRGIHDHVNDINDKVICHNFSICDYDDDDDDYDNGGNDGYA